MNIGSKKVTRPSATAVKRHLGVISRDVQKNAAPSFLFLSFRNRLSGKKPDDKVVAVK